MNRTLVERAKCLLLDAKLPKTYWAEAINMVINMVNRRVNSSGNKSPNELYYGKKPDLTNFGSPITKRYRQKTMMLWKLLTNVKRCHQLVKQASAHSCTL